MLYCESSLRKRNVESILACKYYTKVNMPKQFININMNWKYSRNKV